MRGWRAQFLSAVVLIAATGACGTQGPSPQPTGSAWRGGTLRIAVPEPFVTEVFADPGRETHGFFMRCCLARTLLTYTGATTTDGGTVLVPDLATEMPDVSPDGLTWTFEIQQGIKYAPPHDTIEVTSSDFVTAVERAIRLNRPFIFPPLEIVAGAQEFAEGSASNVSGLETPDPHTLVIRLNRPVGALDHIADVVWAPIPASVAAGHDDDLGLHWPSSGPYRFETAPGDPGADVVALVRNPNWSQATDRRRRALVDRIELSNAGEDVTQALSMLDASELDFVHARLDSELAGRYRSDPAATARVRSTESEYLYRLPMNLAVPPFDDLAVRRAVNFAVDRVAVRDAMRATLEVGGTLNPPTLLSAHFFADSVTGGLLRGYDPYVIGDGRGNLSRARTEMTQSRYDADGDGLCDADVCAAISMPTFDMAVGEQVAHSLEAIGLTVVPVPFTLDQEFERGITNARNRIPIDVLPFGWGFDLSGTELAVLLKGGETIAFEDGMVANTSLVGAPPELLEGWGYEVTSVPSVDDVIARCEGEVGYRRARCWADLDQLVAETIAPWVPVFGVESAWVSSPRVEQYTLDQATFQQHPAWDKVSLVPGSD